ncbi:MAG: cysteine peptidase family C39 domain-containing protein, partial [Candidatus Omnitrophica bacterium]|nr:cysteine peptidase family C39 domain-containing protein [Candidatus Omnitrophota bacterium]
MDETKRKTNEAEFSPQVKKPEFKSSFKPWMRIVAFLVVAVFLPEQAAQAMQYDVNMLWQKPGSGTFTPSYLKDTRSLDIPLAIKNILKDVVNKPVKAIKISSNLTVKLDKPLNMSKQRIEEIYQWLQGRPCGSKALYDFLTYEGAQVAEQDIAVMALTVDILNNVVRPEGDPKVIKNSLYALSQASGFFGHKLYPVKIVLTNDAVDLNNLTPFVAHLKGDHYILVTRVTADKAYFSEEHKEEFLPKEKFLSRFTGNALVLDPAALALLSEAQAKEVMGAGDYDYMTTSEVDNYGNVANDGYYFINKGFFNSANYGGTSVNSIKPTYYVPQAVVLTSNSILNPSTGSYAPTMNMAMITPMSDQWQNSTGRSAGIAMVKMSYNLQGETFFVGRGPEI